MAIEQFDLFSAVLGIKKIPKGVLLLVPFNTLKYSKANFKI